MIGSFVHLGHLPYLASSYVHKYQLSPLFGAVGRASLLPVILSLGIIIIYDILVSPLYLPLSPLSPVEIRLWRWIFPPVLASLSYPPPRGLMGLLGVLSGGDQPPRPSPASTDGASATSFSFYARLKARCHDICPLLPMPFIFGSLWQYLTPHCMVVFS